MWRWLVTSAALAAATPAGAVEVFLGFDGPPSGFRQSYTIDFDEGAVDSALLSYFLFYGTLWYDPAIGDITGNEYFLANDCLPGPSCGGGLVRNFTANDRRISFAFYTPSSFFNCEVGKNPYQDCAAFYEAPQITLDVSLLGTDNEGYTITPSGLTAVPEPATWAMMIGGFALIGGALRRRRTGTSGPALRWTSRPYALNWN